MKKQGTVIYNEKPYEYTIDEDNYIWIINKGVKTNTGQVRPLNSLDNVEEVVLEMLKHGAY